ncbi:MAG TPA: hypothetical protein DCL41_00670 [Bdellovibrionales bacterium]|nr:hypothetical protein [Pseudobdellovibrionaceae bacterium]HAG90349.1 hypothetical protein [Bdellovibrionales bacterium]|tara:strand:+ start:699 stop:896 length:198 start_codon:yes stop_codon:yes gene_type:complete
MSKKLVEFKTTDNQVVYLCPEHVGAIEVVHGSARVEGHLKVFASGFKFLIKEELEDFLKKLGMDT